MRRIYSILSIFAIVGWLSLTVNAAPVLLNAYNNNSSEHDSPGWHGYSLDDSFVGDNENVLYTFVFDSLLFVESPDLYGNSELWRATMSHSYDIMLIYLIRK
jgi:hypothetical protein